MFRKHKRSNLRIWQRMKNIIEGFPWGVQTIQWFKFRNASVCFSFVGNIAIEGLH